MSDATTQKVVFFFRAYNDIDHITPVIWKWVTTTRITAEIVINGSPALLDDYRVQFLRGLNVPVHLASDFFPVKTVEAKPKPTFVTRAINRAKREYWRFFPPQKVKVNPYTQERANAMIEKLFGDTQQGLLVFDWVSKSDKQLNFVKPVIKAARERGIDNLCLPHGDSPYYNKMFMLSDINYDDFEHYKDNPFDVVVVPNPLTAERYTPFRDDTRLKVLGSARYSDEWMAKLAPMIPDYDAPPQARGKLKLVMFLRNTFFPIFWEEVINTIRMITQFDDVFLVVKHHPRGGESPIHHREHLEMSKLNAMQSPNLEIVYNDVHSGALLKWADAVLELGTSISFEAIKLNKPLLAMEYLHSNISTTAHHLPSTAMRCKDDAYDAIQTLRQNPHHRLYTPEERSAFLSAVIDYPDNLVLERYVDLIMNQLQGVHA